MGLTTPSRTPTTHLVFSFLSLVLFLLETVGNVGETYHGPPSFIFIFFSHFLFFTLFLLSTFFSVLFFSFLFLFFFIFFVFVSFQLLVSLFLSPLLFPVFSSFSSLFLPSPTLPASLTSLIPYFVFTLRARNSRRKTIHFLLSSRSRSFV